MEKVYDPIYAVELLEKWDCIEGFINDLYDNGVLTPYRCRDVRVDPLSNRRIAFGEKVTGCLFYFDIGEDVNKIVFPRSEVDKYESEHQEILWKSANNIKSAEHYGNKLSEKEWLTGCELQQILKMSPSMFCDFVNINKIHCYGEYEDFGRVWIKEPDFETEYIDVNNFGEHKFHIADIKRRIGDVHELKIFDTNKNKDEHEKCNELLAENKLLNSRLIGLQAQIAKFEMAQTTSGPTDQNNKPRTASACEAAQASRVEEWKGYAGIMAKVAYECGLEDRTQVTRSAYEKLAKRHGGLSKQALELLRGALPEGVTKKTGGPASQG